MMLDMWKDAEPFLKVIYIAILVCIPLLFLSIYKIWRWFHKEEVIKRIQQNREEQQENVFYEAHHAINKARTIWYCVGTVVMIVLLATLPSSLPKAWQIGVFLVGFFILYIVNNWYVTSHWRCPVCKEQLPCLVGRSSLRPKWIDTCPHCGYGNTNPS